MVSAPAYCPEDPSLNHNGYQTFLSIVRIEKKYKKKRPGLARFYKRTGQQVCLSNPIIHQHEDLDHLQKAK